MNVGKLSVYKVSTTKIKSSFVEAYSKPHSSGVTTGHADPASGEGGKIGLKCGTFFANLTKVLAKICVCARN